MAGDIIRLTPRQYDEFMDKYLTWLERKSLDKAN